MPLYDFTAHQRVEEVRRVEPADVVILEGVTCMGLAGGADMHACMHAWHHAMAAKTI